MGKQGMTKKSKAVPKKKLGRPTKYSQELADKICFELAQGYSLRTVCRAEDMPSGVTVFSWLRKYPEFLSQYTRAKQESADAMADEVLDIADDASNDWMEYNADDDAKERYSFNGEHVQRSRLRIETRKWLMAKMKPKVYGDKVDVTSDGRELPTPIVNILAVNNTKDDNNSEIIDGEVSEIAAKHQIQEKSNIMDDINV